MRFTKPQPFEAKDGQESVWDYPRPPKMDPTSKLVQVIFNGITIAETRRAIRVLETSHPPGYYIPRTDIQMDFFERDGGRHTRCEFKGTASYWTITVGQEIARSAAWSYEAPVPAFKEIEGYLSFYPGRVDSCYVDGEKVRPQEGGFYGGWITSEIVGPFKGAAHTRGW